MEPSRTRKTRAVPSAEAVTTFEPSGLYAAAFTGPRPARRIFRTRDSRMAVRSVSSAAGVGSSFAACSANPTL